MRWNQKIGSTERSLLAVEQNKKLKNLFWDSSWQSKQGKKSGRISGQKNALLYRQQDLMAETLKRLTYGNLIMISLILKTLF